jgi:phosphoserine phosphatase
VNKHDAILYRLQNALNELNELNGRKGGNMAWKYEKPAAPETRVILVRHGESTLNAQDRHQESSGEPVLTELGRRAAQQTGLFLSGLAIDALYVSSLRRAQETASEILAIMKPTITLQNMHVERALREVDLPGWQERCHRDTQAEYIEDYRCWKQSPLTFTMVDPQTQERFYPVHDLYGRAKKFWEDILPRHRGQTLLVVGHSGTNRALINTALNLGPAHYHALKQSSCGISILKFIQEEILFAQLEVLNWTSHLEISSIATNP